MLHGASQDAGDVVGAFSTFYADAKKIFDEQSRKKQIHRLIAKVPTIAAYAYRHSIGRPYVYPDNDLSFAGNFLNMLFKMTELKYQPNPVLERALDDEAFTLNLGIADGRFFAVNCGAGVDAAAMNRLDRRFPKTKVRFERAAFRAAAWELLVGYAGRRADLQIRIDGGEPLASLSVMVGRTDPYTYYKGRGLRVTPEASLDTGLDVLSVRKLARRSVPRIAWQVFGSARHVKGRDIDYVHDAPHVLVTAEEPFPVQVDGDSLGEHKRLEVELARDALWVVA